MTNLLLSYSDIPGAALSWISSGAFDEDFMIGNLHHGPRFLRGKEASENASSVTITYDLGSGVTKAADHLIIARADLLQAQGISAVYLKAGSTSTYGSATEIYADASFASATLYGPQSNDYLATFAESSVYRYWFIEYVKSGSCDIEHSKTYFGKAFDFGIDADFTMSRPPRNESDFVADSGSRKITRIDEPAYAFDFTWTSIPDATLKEWLENFVDKSRMERFFLFTTANHQILDSKRIIHVRLNDASATKIKADYNEITASFEEVFG